MTGETHQAAVLLPPAEPSDTQLIVGERTRTWPVPSLPFGPPSSATSRSRASIAPTAGQGWLLRQVPSISRAATPATRTFAPSAHQIGPSPSQTARGVHLKDEPAGMIGLAARAVPGDGQADRISAHARLAVNRIERTIRSLEPAGNPAMVTAGAPPALAEAVGPVPTLRARTLRHQLRMSRALNTIAASVHIGVRAAMTRRMRPRHRARTVRGERGGGAGQCDRGGDRQSRSKNAPEHRLSREDVRMGLKEFTNPRSAIATKREALKDQQGPIRVER